VTSGSLTASADRLSKSVAPLAELLECARSHRKRSIVNAQ
jgi:hypothetical protein